jgi:hypothetical protein
MKLQSILRQIIKEEEEFDGNHQHHSHASNNTLHLSGYSKHSGEPLLCSKFEEELQKLIEKYCSAIRSKIINKKIKFWGVKQPGQTSPEEIIAIVNNVNMTLDVSSNTIEYIVISGVEASSETIQPNSNTKPGTFYIKPTAVINIVDNTEQPEQDNSNGNDFNTVLPHRKQEQERDPKHRQQSAPPRPPNPSNSNFSPRANRFAAPKSSPNGI